MQRRSPQRGFFRPLAAAVLLVAARSTAQDVVAQEVAQWEFDGSLEATTASPPLVARAAPPAGAPRVVFQELPIAGGLARVALVGRGTYLRVKGGFRANGGGQYVNRYTIVMDVLFPDRSPSGGWAALYNTNVSQPPANDGEAFVDPSGGVGVQGVYGGRLRDGEWYRLAIAVDLVEGYLRFFLDGEQVNAVEGVTLDSGFSLWSTADGDLEGFSLFGDDDRENAEVCINSLQFRDAALCPGQVAALGRASAAGIPRDDLPAEECARPPANLAIKETPYLQWVTRREITVMWETNEPADSTVFYRRRGGEWQSAVVEEPVTIHEVRLGGFDPGETVEYYARSRQGGEEVSSETAAFSTSPPGSRPFRLGVWGDSQGNPGVFGRLVSRLAPLEPDLLVSVGDVVDNGAVYSQWGRELLTPLRPLSRSVPFFIAVGNHERNSHWF
ncbi:MAG: metallophosphoesterase, partial [Planctomycetota bacterium]|nr:metallophosphoesterase [Planctomycetota bacterium]